MPKYIERELSEKVSLCDGEGNLNPDAKGWSRHPLHVCNLSGHFPRKKKWNFWIVLNEEISISMVIANIDYTGMANVTLMDLRNKTVLSDNVVLVPKGAGMDMPEEVEKDVKLIKKYLKLSFTQEENGIRLRVDCPGGQNGKLRADIMLSKPPGHETLNVVIPWNDTDEFYFMSKQNTLAATGKVQHGDREYVFGPEDSFGVLDFGRGMWPSDFIWNWASFNHRQDGELIGINMGSKWTDGTGYNENGLCLNGRLYKISEDLIFEYDTKDFMKPWRIRTGITDDLDLVLTPTFDKTGGKSSEGSKTGGTHQCFGHFNGRVRAGDRIVQIKNAFGWAEQVIGGW